MKTVRFIAPAMMSVFLLSSCAQDGGPGTGETVGTIAGVAAGAFLGSQIGSGTGRLVGTAVGATLGGFLGNHLGSKLDARDREAAQRAVYESMEHNRDGDASSWHNPNTGHSGYVVPDYTYYDESNRPCRDFTHVMKVDGREETVSGTACRQNNGEWKTVDS